MSAPGISSGGSFSTPPGGPLGAGCWAALSGQTLMSPVASGRDLGVTDGELLRVVTRVRVTNAQGPVVTQADRRFHHGSIAQLGQRVADRRVDALARVQRLRIGLLVVLSERLER